MSKLVTYEEFCIRVTFDRNFDRANVDIAFKELDLVNKISEYHTGISKSDLERIFRGNYMTSKNGIIYTIPAKLFFDILKAGNKDCKYIFVEDEDSRRIDNQ